MKRTVLLILFYFFTVDCFSQSMFGVYGGAGITTSYTFGYTPSFGAIYLVSPLRHIYLGGRVFNEGYSMQRADEEFSHFGGYGYTITQNGSYLFITPTIDVGIGHKEHTHPFFTAGPGIFLSGEQNITVASSPTVLPVGINPGLSFAPGKTPSNVAHTIFRFSMGVQFHVTLLNNWELIMAPEVVIIPSWLSNNSYGYNGDAAMNIKTNYLSATVGIMHKRNWQPFKSLRTWGGY